MHLATYVCIYLCIYLPMYVYIYVSLYKNPLTAAMIACGQQLFTTLMRQHCNKGNVLYEGTCRTANIHW